MSAQFGHWFRVDLNEGPVKEWIKNGAFTQDNMANLIGVKVYRGLEPVTLEGSVSLYVIRKDGNTVLCTGNVEDNKAWVELPESAYACPGTIQMAMRLTNGETKTVLAAIWADVKETTTDAIIDPGHVIPDIDELLAYIDAMEQATDAANQAADDANSAASYANSMATTARNQAASAHTAAAGANSAAMMADQAASDANSAASSATTAANKANANATKADDSAAAAYTAAEEATNAALAANTAATEAGRVNINQTKSGEVITVTTTDRDGQQTANTLTDPVTRLSLLSDNVPNTVQSIIYGTDGSVAQIAHTNNGAEVRMDTFTYDTDTITEARVLAAGGSLTMVTNLNTLQTTVTYSAS